MPANYTESAIGEIAESEKVYCMIEPQIKGKKGLDIGCGGWKVPGAKGIDIRSGIADYVGDITKGIDILIQAKRKKKFDFIFSSHLLEDFAEDIQYKLLVDWVDHIKEDGLLILYVPQKGKYVGCNVAHKREFEKDDLEKMYNNINIKVTGAWYEADAPMGGYSILMIGRKPKGWKLSDTLDYLDEKEG